jgi:hypothetical protein
MIVGERGNCQRFTLKTAHEQVIASIEHFDSDSATDPTIISQIYFGHAPLRDATKELITA